MKIVGVSLGTRNGMNDSICKEALHAAAELGAEVSFIHLLDWDIKPCTGCVACSRALVSGKGNICARKDDFEDFWNILMDADGILFVDPIFEKGASGLFDVLTDRFGPRSDRGVNLLAMHLHEIGQGKPINPKLVQDKPISFIGIGGSQWTTSAEYDHSMLVIGTMWKIIDNEVFQWAKSIFMNDEKVERIKEIGRNLYHAAADIENAKFLGQGVCPHCHNTNFYVVPHSKEVLCCRCGITGTFEIDDEEIKFVFPEDQLRIAHDTLSGKEIHANDIMNNEAEAMECVKTQKWKDSQERLKSYAIEEILPPAKR